MTGADRQTSIESIVQSISFVARLGESDLRGWWASRAFGAAGRVVLKQRLPNTWRIAAVELDVASAANRHNEVINRSNAVHLFSDTWPVRRWTESWLSEQKMQRPPDEFFELLEKVSLDDVHAALLEGRVEPKLGSGSAVRIGSIDRSSFDSPEDLVEPVRQLASAYTAVGDQLVVPYLEVAG